jgi:DNA segregation ATPase FtsK/SpoIIIE, S-DNA-T family
MSTTAKKRITSRRKNASQINLKKEMWGIILLGLAALIGGALFSLQIGDGRLMGPFGQLMALGIYALLGMGSYLIIIALFSISWGIFTNRFNIRDGRLWFGYVGATFTGTILMYLIFPGYRLQGISAGGKTGEFLGTLGVSLFSKTGTFLLTFTLMILFLMLATQSSPVKGTISIAQNISKTLKFFGKTILLLLTSIKSLFIWESIEEEEKILEKTDLEKEVIIENKKTEEIVSVKKTVETPEKIKNKNKKTNENIKSTKDVAVKKAVKKRSVQVTKPFSTGNTDKIVKKNSDEKILKGEIVKTESTNKTSDENLPIISKMVETNVKNVVNLEEFIDEKGEFILPDPDFLYFEKVKDNSKNNQFMLRLADKVVSSLSDFKIKGKVNEIHPGPVVTMYEFVPEARIKVSKIEALNKDLALTLAATRVRIVAPIPGKAAVGIEVPNEKRQTVFLKEIIADSVFTKSKSKLTMVLGKDIKGKSIVCDLAKAPHLLVAGATGSGKSVGVNTMIMSILFRATPKDVRMILIDPKMVELNIYDDIPHLLLPVVTDPQKANLALQWAVKEMERRYQLLSEVRVRNLDDYNKKIQEISLDELKGNHEHLPAIVIVIDEFADLMMVSAKEVEISVARIAQKARAVSIHLIVATQRPSADVITGLIKSNFPTRIAFMVSSRTDSNVILGKSGAESLLGNGDMLFSNRGLEPVRVHGSFVSTAEVQKVVDHLKTQGQPQYNLTIVEPPEETMDDVDDKPYDKKWNLALDVVSRERNASISNLQRRLSIGYNRAANIIDRMQQEGIVSSPNNKNQREVLISSPPD